MVKTIAQGEPIIASAVEEPILVTSILDIEANKVKMEARRLLAERKFAQIEKQAGEYRDTQAMFPDGFWKLGHFYLGLAQLSDAATEADWTKNLQLLRDWAQKNPKSVTAQVALARAYYEDAQRSRGEEFSYQVKEEQWKAMAKRLDLASKALTASLPLRDQCPGWYAVAQRVAFLEGRPLEEFDAITQEGLSKFPHYYDFHFKRLNYLMPRWYGEEGDWQEYAAHVADRMDGDKGDLFYARALWYMQTMVETEKAAELAEFDWPRAKRGFKQLIQMPHPHAAAGAYAQAAWLARDRETLKFTFEQLIGNHIDYGVWRSKEEFIEARQWALK